MGRKESHEEFVRNLHGSTPLTVIATFINIAYVLFYHDIVLAFISCFVSDFRLARWRFLSDIVFLILPCIFIATNFVDQVNLMCFGTVSVVIIIILSILQQKLRGRKLFLDLQRYESVDFRREIISRFRGSILLFTAIVILAVDFPIFPRWMAKTEKDGYSVMDAGVGAFVVAGASVMPYFCQERCGRLSDVLQDLAGSIVLMILGVGRSLIVYLLDYQSPEAEYGKHWNFFGTLAVIKVGTGIISLFIRPKFAALFGGMLLITYEIILQLGCYDWLVNEQSKEIRLLPSFIHENRTGIFSSIGFVALTLIWSSVARALFSPSERSRHRILPLEIIAAVIMPLLLLGFLPRPSRRTGNAAYVLWIVHLSALYIFVCFILRVVVDFVSSTLKNVQKSEDFGRKARKKQKLKSRSSTVAESKISAKLPSGRGKNICVVTALNFNALPAFLLGNLCTGIVNLSIETISAPNSVAFVILFLYMTLISGVMFFLYAFDFKVPLRLPLRKMHKE